MKIKKIVGLPKTLFDIFLTRLGKFAYSYASRLDKDAEAIFLNYGYAGEHKVDLRKEDEGNRYCIQLYNRIVTTAPVRLEGLDILEVGSGRGGGASYLTKYFNPNSYVGVDICIKAVDFSRKHYTDGRVSFFCDDARKLSFPDNSFDVVINVESSHSYASIDRFFRETARVLKPGGYFLFADFRNKNLIEPLKEQLKKTGLKIRKEEMITPGIVKALDLDSERRENLIKALVPKFIRRPSMTLAGVSGTSVYKLFVTRDREYFNFVLQKEKE